MAGQPQAVYNLAVQPQAGQQPAVVAPQQQPAAAVGPYQFAADDITNPYAMTWNAYDTKLKPFLNSKYPVQPPAPPRVAQAQAQAQPPAAEAGGRGHALAAIKEALSSQNSPLKTSNPAWSNNQIKSLVDSANQAVPALAAGAVFVLDNFAKLILPELNNLARQNASKRNGQQLAAPIAINRANIGV